MAKQRIQRGGIIPRNGRYCVKWSHQGKQYWRTFATKKAAEAFRARATVEIDDGVYQAPKKDVAFEKFALQWLEERGRKVRSSTVRFYQPIVKHNLIRFFGERKLRQIDYGLCNKYVQEKIDQGRLSPRSINGHLMTLKMIFAEAIKHGYLKQNPVQHVERLKNVKKEFRVLSEEELRKFFEHVTVNYRVLFLTAALTGLRQGEVLGLTWDCVNFEEGTLTVKHTLQRRTKKKAAKSDKEEADKQKADKQESDEYLLAEPKTENSKRTIALPSSLLLELKKHKLQSEPNPFNLVFANSVGRPIDGLNLYKREFLGALERAGVPKVRFHDLRHTYISHRLALGHDIASVAADAGQVPTTTLSTYTHALKKHSRERADEVATALLGKADVSSL